ncbi:MAG: DNA alkylation repair protein [Bacteroidales bacterium]|nr:DNA alkylation repair protein [Bacteroidales bacterium]NLK82077.1 hypothetical protein [Bacteroidales bacterium]HPY82034.1 DNA alkylation repair protein [Bacteroidales bacterium]
MQKQFSEAIAFIKHHQDGEVAEMLRYRGLQYNMIYGVSSSLLYDYAKKHPKNQELSRKLWEQDFREAKLLALMLADPKTIEIQELQSIIYSFTNHEMVEIASLHLLPHIPFAIDRAYEWIQDEREFVKMTGYMLANRVANRIKHVSFRDLSKFLPEYERDFTHGSFFVRNAVINAFQEVAFRNPGLKGPIEQATKRVLAKNEGTEFELLAKDMLQVLNYC